MIKTIDAFAQRYALWVGMLIGSLPYAVLLCL